MFEFRREYDEKYFIGRSSPVSVDIKRLSVINIKI